jgi:hypothetical protein
VSREGLLVALPLEPAESPAEFCCMGVSEGGDGMRGASWCG